MLFNDIECFLSLAEHLNYSTSAAQLYISQPSLSKTIAGLEGRLGFRLFDRSTRRVELTEDGKRFYVISKAFIEQCESLMNGTHDVNMLEGKVTIGTENIVDTGFLPFLINGFQMRYPNVKVSTSIQKTDNLLNSIRSGKIDIGLLSSFEIPRDEFNSKFLYPYETSVLVSANHRLSHKKSLSPRDLQKETFVLMDASTSRSTQIILNLCAAADINLMYSMYAANFRQMFLLTSQQEGICFNLTNTNAWEFWNLRSIPLNIGDVLPDQSRVGLSMIWKKDCDREDIRALFQTVEQMRFFLPLAVKLVDD